MNPLSLAFIGDAVYEVLVRTWILRRGLSPHELHRKSAKYVRASGQVDFYEKLKDHLSAEEKVIIKRGRNTKSHTVPKNADVKEYRWASGVEALIGHLYLMGEEERIGELFSIAFGPGMEE